MILKNLMAMYRIIITVIYWFCEFYQSTGHTIAIMKHSQCCMSWRAYYCHFAKERIEMQRG